MSKISPLEIKELIIRMNKPNIIAVILARGGSKGIPRKNLADLGGKPLVAHMITHALNTSTHMDVVVSTEDEEISEAAKQFGAQVPFMRPKELAKDDVPSLPAVQHAVKEMEKREGHFYDLVVYLQPTAPLCRPQDIDTCVNKLLEDSVLRSAVTITEVETHPFKMKRLIESKHLINFVEQGFEDMRPRQSLPKVYRRAGSVYASRRDVVMNNNTLVGEPCLGVLVPKETAFDIDTPLDLEMARLIYSKKSK
jgi:N-acylneuraminate cytidylyltransferase/CMP-N,N'-diacetyllegionaminic acid synthase